LLLIFSENSFPQNHALGMLSNLSALNMGVQNLQSFQHSDVLEKIKMQVRDMKFGDFTTLHPSFTSQLHSSLGFHAAAQNHQNPPQNSNNNSNNNDSPNGFPFSSAASAVAAPNKDGKLLCRGI